MEDLKWYRITVQWQEGDEIVVQTIDQRAESKDMARRLIQALNHELTISAVVELHPSEVRLGTLGAPLK